MSANENDKNVAPAANPEEAALKFELLKAQVEAAQVQAQNTRFDLAAKKAAAAHAKENIALERRAKKAAAAKAELDLANAKRAAARELADEAENATCVIYDQVNAETMKRSMLELDTISRRFAGQPITIILNSPGGSVIDGLALYDHIQGLRAKGHYVTVICRGMAASMGGILLQSGDKRIIGAQSVVLIHEVASGTAGKVNEMQDRVDFSKLLWKKCATVLAGRSKMTVEEIQAKAFKFDWWLEANEAVELGFADEIG